MFVGHLNENNTKKRGQNILKAFITNQADILTQIFFASFTRFSRLDFHPQRSNVGHAQEDQFWPAACRSAVKYFKGRPKKQLLPRQKHVSETSIDTFMKISKRKQKQGK